MNFLNDLQDMVAEFHRAMKQPVGVQSEPKLVEHELRVRLIEEEAKELTDAIKADDLIMAIDGACDLIYVTLGAMVSAGIDIHMFFREVHRSNMAKVGGHRREDGKILKPDGWTPPDLGHVLRWEIADALQKMEDES